MGSGGGSLASLKAVPLPIAYHRPDTLDEALALLADPSRVPLAGGTVLNADREPSAVEMVDLQSLGLDEISDGPGFLRIGATVTLDALARHHLTPDWLAEIARAEAPSTLRTLATVGGLVASRWGDSMLLAALLASFAQVELAKPPGSGDDGLGISRSSPDPAAGADAEYGGGADRPSRRPVLLEAILDRGIPNGAVITSVTIDVTGSCASAATGRTPADVPIVAAVARTLNPTNGTRAVKLALSGVASAPVLVDPDDPTARLSPPGDFRGSAEYRTELARVLSTRALEELS